LDTEPEMTMSLRWYTEPEMRQGAGERTVSLRLDTEPQMTVSLRWDTEPQMRQ